MKRLLLDTHVFIWLVNGDKRVSKHTAKLVSDPANEVYLSYFSLFEMVIKSATGKMTFDPQIIQKLETVGIKLLYPDVELLGEYTVYNPENRDPFDNALLTVAKTHGLVLVTNDHKIIMSNSGVNILDAAA